MSRGARDANRGAHARGDEVHGNQVPDRVRGCDEWAEGRGYLGLDVLAVDRNDEQLAELARSSHALPGRIQTDCVDLETGTIPVLPRGPFTALLVFRYLHRPLAQAIESWLAPGGLLLYETFTVSQRTLGWGPSRDAFLLQPGELPQLFPGLSVEVFEEGLTGEASPAWTARLRASRPR